MESKMKRNLYIAYGSNLNITQMLRRCPDAVKIGASALENYKLAFRGNSRSGVLNIEPADGERVPVGIWGISAADEENLDVYEGCPTLYEKKMFKLPVNGKTMSAMAYIMTPGRRIAVPSDYYFQIVSRGYLDFGFDSAPLLTALEEARHEFDADVQDTAAAKRVVDAFAERQRNGMSYCPRCGRDAVKQRLITNALSRYANLYICDACGTDEAVRDFTGDPLPLREWAIAKKANRKK